ncbi:ABC transporter ATP-binding protein [Acetobacter farinalis]|uniref:ABC transporter ATP-binding protein n=1 Tax=Acetobacter farinalis TaxID=1260984 RepID=A0ABT3Q768_9PROT|nr:ABC transporter ATP-binding protein [Acetobacter farinalis]MCX2561125.1 ABC transporter ATP-binding protein [Acetobacter farinalis]NHO29626.1 ATP-binding cassette domain-containing protein [Acetobacter farinalis]
MTHPFMTQPSPSLVPHAGLRAAHVSVRYGRRAVLHDVTAGPFAPGTVCALLGPNGSGKSTLLRAIAGLVPSSAHVTLNGEDLSRMSLPDRTRRCLYLPQALPAAVQLPVLEALMAARQTVRTPLPSAPAEEDAIQAALESLSLFGIPHLAMQAMDELSGGQRQLVGLAQALSRKPKALLLDEPLSALDLHHQFAVMDILRRETAAHQLVTVLVLHDLNSALNLTDHVTVLHEGRITASGPPAAVLTPELLRETYRVRARVDTGADGRKFVSVEGIA